MLKAGKIAQDVEGLKGIITDLNQQIAERDARIAELESGGAVAGGGTVPPAPTTAPESPLTAEDQAALDWLDQFVAANSSTAEDTVGGEAQSATTPTEPAAPLDHA